MNTVDIVEMHKHVEEVASYIAKNTRLTQQEAYDALLASIDVIIDAAKPDDGE